MNFKNPEVPKGPNEGQNIEEDRERIAQSLGLLPDASWDEIRHAEDVLGKSDDDKEPNKPKGSAAAA